MPTEVYTALLALLGVLIGYLADVLKTRIIVKGDTKNHISKARFDKEFEIYQELFEKNLKLVFDTRYIIKIMQNNKANNRDEIIDVKNYLTKLLDSLNEACFSTRKYAPFIEDSIYINFENITSISGYIYELTKLLCDNPKIDKYIMTSLIDYSTTPYTKKTAIQKIYELGNKIGQLSNETIIIIRNYLKSLDVKEK